jgi:hypothetical protein
MEEKVLEAIKFVHTYAPSISDWKILKRELLNNLPMEKRRLFSRRDEKTKKQNFNDFEKNISVLWEEMSGCKLIFRDDEQK